MPRPRPKGSEELDWRQVKDGVFVSEAGRMSRGLFPKFPREMPEGQGGHMLLWLLCLTEPTRAGQRWKMPFSRVF